MAKNNKLITQISFEFMTDLKILSSSFGKVTSPDLPKEFNHQKNDKFDPEGLYSEEIFGICKISNHSYYNEDGMIKRSNSAAHMCTPIYINPILFKNNDPLSTILDTPSVTLPSKIIESTTYLILVKLRNDLVPDKEIKVNIDTTTYTLKTFIYKGNKLLQKYGYKTYVVDVKNHRKIKDIVYEMRSNSFKYKISDISVYNGPIAIMKLLEYIPALKDDLKLEKNQKRKKVLINISNLIDDYGQLFNTTLSILPAGLRDLVYHKDEKGQKTIKNQPVTLKYSQLLNIIPSYNFYNWDGIPRSEVEIICGDKKPFSTITYLYDINHIIKNRLTDSIVSSAIIESGSYGTKSEEFQNHIGELWYVHLLKSLASKKGKIRNKVLKTRVDQSGRTVISPDPKLKYDYIGIPIQLFVDVYKDLIKKDLEDKKMIQESKTFDKLVYTEKNQSKEVIEMIKYLKEFAKNELVSVVRFPTLHRFNKLSFKITLVDDITIHLHPLVCAGYNADFDGDNQSIFAIISESAKQEARKKLLPSRNLLSATGKPMCDLSQDMIFGCYYLSKMNSNEIKSNTVYNSMLTLERMLELGNLDPQEPIFYSYKNKKIITTYGRLLLDSLCSKYLENTNNLLSIEKLMIENQKKSEDKPQSMERLRSLFLTKGNLSDIMKKVVVSESDLKDLVNFIDNMKNLGLRFATLSATSISITDVYTHQDKEKIFREAVNTAKTLPSGDVKIKFWERTIDDFNKKTYEDLPSDNPLKMFAESGSRGNKNQIAQLISTKGQIKDTEGNTKEMPIISSFIDGMSTVEVFQASDGARKGMYDRSNKTAETGELSRILVFMANRIIISEGDCGDTEGVIYKDIKNIEENGKENLIQSLFDQVLGKITLEDVLDLNGNVVIKAGTPILKKHKKYIEQLESIRCRSPLTCKSAKPICAKCYGMDFSKNLFPKVGACQGVMSVQTISEIASQLTMRTFHTGGSAKGDVTGGFDLLSKTLTTKLVDNTTGDYNKKVFPHKPYPLNYTVEEEEEFMKNKINVLSRFDIISKYEEKGVFKGNEFVENLRALSVFLNSIYLENGIKVKLADFELVAKGLSLTFSVMNKDLEDYSFGQIVSWKEFTEYNSKAHREFIENGVIIQPMIVAPLFIDARKMGVSPLNPYQAILNMELNKSISNILTINSIDKQITPLSHIGVNTPLLSDSNISDYKEKWKSGITTSFLNVAQKQGTIKEKAHLQEQSTFDFNALLDFSTEEETVEDSAVDNNDNFSFDFDTDTKLDYNVGIVENNEDYPLEETNVEKPVAEYDAEDIVNEFNSKDETEKLDSIIADWSLDL